MTSRERVLAALRHERPDRTPRDFWIEAPALRRLQAYLGLADEEAVRQHLGIDMRHLNAIAPPDRVVILSEAKDLAPAGATVWQNYWGERFIWKETPWGPMREDLPGALHDATSLDDLRSFPWPTPDLCDYSHLAEQARRFEQYALLYGFADIWQRPGLVRGWERMFVDMAARPDWTHFLCRTFTDFYKEDYTRAAEATGGRIDLYLLLSDLGSQTGPLISLPMFRQIVAPYIRELADCVHGLGGRLMFHSCGAVAAFIPDLIVLGVDVLDPIQPVTDAMQPESLQRDFGGRLVFHGGIDMQSVLPFGTPQEVQAQVRRYCEALGGQGGYILAPTHLFQPDVPPENIVAMYEADWAV